MGGYLAKKKKNIYEIDWIPPISKIDLTDYTDSSRLTILIPNPVS